MNIAILTSGRLPVPATRGGAVEQLIDSYLDYNEAHGLHNITVYSVHPGRGDGGALADAALPRQQHNHYVFFRGDRLRDHVEAKVRGRFARQVYYDPYIELFLTRCIAHLRRQHYDCVVVENRPGFTCRLARAVSIPIVNHLHNDYLHADSYRARDVKEASAGVLTCSDFIGRRVEAVAATRQPPVYTVHNGIDLQRFTDAVALERRSLGLQADDFVIVYSGRLTEEKGILQLLQAVKRLRQLARLKLLILGASFYGRDRQATPFEERLRQEAEDISSRVVFTGFVAYADMPRYLKMVDVAVVPSMWEEPFGLTVVEAMAAGRSLIATRSGAIPEICEGGAILVDREDVVEGLCRALRYVYDHPDEASRLGAQGQQRAQQYGREVYARKFFEALSRVVGGTGNE